MVGAVIFALLLGTIVASIGYAIVHSRFSQSPPYRWRRRVLEIATQLRERRRMLQQNAPPSVEDAAAHATRNALDTSQRALPLDGLLAVPGIGPGTLQTLQQFGISRLPEILERNLQSLPNIGPQKAATIELGARGLLREFEADFRAGQSFADRLQTVRRAAQDALAQYCDDLQRVDREIEGHAPKVSVANEITLWKFFRELPMPDWQRFGPEESGAASQIEVGTGADVFAAEMQRAAPVAAPATSETRVISPTVAAAIADAAGFGMFIVHHAGKGRNERLQRLQAVMLEIFDVVDDAKKHVTGAINRHVTPKRDARTWLAALHQPTAPSVQLNRRRIFNAVLGPPDQRSPDEHSVARALGPAIGDPTPEPKRQPNRDPISMPNVQEPQVAPSAVLSLKQATPTAPVAPRTPVDPFRVALDRGAASPTPSAPLQSNPQHADERRRLEAYARFGMMVGYADGRLATPERAEVRCYLAERFGHDPILARHIDPLIELCTVERPQELETLEKAAHAAHDDGERRALLAWAQRIAGASSGVNDREFALLQRLERMWGEEGPVPRERPAERSSQRQAAPAREPAAVAAPKVETPTPAKPDPRVVLEIPLDAVIAAELVRRKHAFLLDRLDAKKLDGMGEEFVQLAVKKRASIEAAALELLRPFGETLTPPAVPPPSGELRPNADLDEIFGA